MIEQPSKTTRDPGQGEDGATMDERQPEPAEQRSPQGPERRDARPARRPYAAPVIQSGEAFERVQLASGCNEGVFDCDIPC